MKIIIICLLCILLSCCYDTIYTGDLIVRFCPSEDGTAFIPGSSIHFYEILLNDNIYDLPDNFGTSYTIHDILYGEYLFTCNIYNIYDELIGTHFEQIVVDYETVILNITVFRI